MYQVGDYVVSTWADGIYVFDEIDYALAKTVKIKNMCKPEYRLVPESTLRPAVLADWAVEIPEKYRAWYHDAYKYLILVNLGNGLHKMLLFDKLLNIVISNNKYEISNMLAAGLSLLLGCTIMPFEQYQKYMEAQK